MQTYPKSILRKIFVVGQIQGFQLLKITIYKFFVRFWQASQVEVIFQWQFAEYVGIDDILLEQWDEMIRHDLHCSLFSGDR